MDTTIIYGDRAYNDYNFEDILNEFGILLVAQRRCNSKRKHTNCMSYLQKCNRKKIETVFSVIINLMPRCIHAITAKGFILKIFFFILAYSINRVYSN